ncbi:zinc metalloproteinase nas-1-like [Cloeon dipterum]|uniref:zinc metalloproteinase nas-1-like n=1 Tax=Cloeon dipterum TaxID=197152 RepID=UPI00321F9293
MISSGAIVLLALVNVIVSNPIDDGMELRSGRKRPLASITPNDKRGPNGEKITNHYAVVSPKKKWPGGVVPWQYKSTDSFTDAQKKNIETGLGEIMNATCIKFRAKTDADVAYVTIQNSQEGCWAGYGYTGSSVTLNLAKDCYPDTSFIIHEMMHVLGFDHEQQRYDRDIYLEVQWENIQAGNENNFDKYPRTKAYPRYPYDLFSVMQYYLTAFGKGGRPTMLLTFQNETINKSEIGNAKKMTRSDILRMRSAYKCDFNGESGGVGRMGIDLEESAFAKHNFF